MKSSFELLHNVHLEDEVTCEGKLTMLIELLMEQEINGDKLFIAMEQGTGLAKDNVKVILNPKIKHNARKWLVESYPTITFQHPTEKNTSVDSQEF